MTACIAHHYSPAIHIDLYGHVQLSDQLEFVSNFRHFICVGHSSDVLLGNVRLKGFLYMDLLSYLLIIRYIY